MADKSVDFLNVLRGPKEAVGLKIVEVTTMEPDTVRFRFLGTEKAIDKKIFEIPVSMYPLRTGDKFLTLPILSNYKSQRWGVIEKLNAGIIMATMKGPSSLQIDGMNVVYTAPDVIIPYGYTFVSGDRVNVLPGAYGAQIRYYVMQRY